MIYPFKCEKCEREIEIQMTIKEYESKGNSQRCNLDNCNGKMKRIYTPVGISFGPGFFNTGGYVVCISLFSHIFIEMMNSI